MTDHQLVQYAFLLAANHEMYAVEPGWRLFAICLTTGAAYEMHGGFNGLALAVACRDSFIKSGMDPAREPATFTRLSNDAALVAVSPPSRPSSRRHGTSSWATNPRPARTPSIARKSGAACA